MTPEQIAADRAVCDAATAGPWIWEIPDEPTRWQLPIELSDGNHFVLRHDWDAYEFDPAEDAEFEEKAFEADGKKWTPVNALSIDKDDMAFIAAARTRWPMALDEIERLRDLLRRAVRWVQNGTPAVVTYHGQPIEEYREYEADLAAFKELFPDL